MSRPIPVAFVLALMLGCACSDDTPDVAAAPPALAVGVAEVVAEEFVEPIRGTGTIAPDKATNISPRVDGIIEEIYVDVGDRVEAGAALFRTRETDYRIQLEQQQAAVRLARAEAEKTRRDLGRTERLHEKSVVSVEQLDDGKTRDRIARAKLEVAEASLARAKQDLEDTLVTAPYAGTITRRNVDEGMFLRTMMSSGSPVLEIMKTDVVLAIVYVSEIHLPRIKVGTPAIIRIDGLDREYESEVRIVNDRVENTSHAIELRVPIRNEDFAIKPGLFAKAEILPSARPAVIVERCAVLGSGRSRYVFVPEDGKAARRPIEVRDLDAARVEVIAGLSPGDQVLVGPNLARLDDGSPVLLQVSDVAL